MGFLEEGLAICGWHGLKLLGGGKLAVGKRSSQESGAAGAEPSLAES